MDLSGFKAFDFSEGVPYLSITQNGATFNKAVTLKLGSPAFVRFLINTETKQVALQVCSKETPFAVPFYKPRKTGVMSVRWNARDLICAVQRLLPDSLETHGFRVSGELLDGETMLFDLTSAHPLV